MIMPRRAPAVEFPTTRLFAARPGRFPPVRRVTPDALGAVRAHGRPIRATPRESPVAAFDFDGTCIQGNSPVMLVRLVVHRRVYGPRWCTLSWAFAYKTRLPQNEA